MEYIQKQVGWTLLGILLSIALIIGISYFVIPSFKGIGFQGWIIILSALVVVTLLFYKLTIKVNHSGIQLVYGIGLIRINLNISHLESVEVTRTPWYYGLGIKITPEGMIYNIHSLKAIRISHDKNGKKST